MDNNALSVRKVIATSHCPQQVSENCIAVLSSQKLIDWSHSIQKESQSRAVLQRNINVRPNQNRQINENLLQERFCTILLGKKTLR